MRVFLPSLLLVLLAALLPLPAPVGAQRAETVFTGTWVVTATSKPDAVAKGTKFTFAGGGVTRTGTDGKTAKGLFTVDIMRKPQTIDIVFAGGKDKMYGVYAFVGPILRINYAPDAPDRPTIMDTEKNKNWTLLVLSRLNQ